MPAPRCSGFSLIELLVVISIIAILAAMLLPAIGLVKRAARAAECASTMRQGMIGILAFAGDNDGGLPLPVNEPSVAHALNWLTWPNEGYCRWSVAVTSYLDTADANEWWNMKWNQCKGVNDSPWNNAATFTYIVYNIHLDGAGSGKCVDFDDGANPNNLLGHVYSEAEAAAARMPLAKVQRTSETVGLADGYYYAPPSLTSGQHHSFGSVSNVDANWLHTNLDKHGNKANYAFLDGHVEALQKGDAIARAGTDWDSRTGSSYNFVHPR